MDCITVEDRGSCSRVGPTHLLPHKRQRSPPLVGSTGAGSESVFGGKEAASGWLGAGSGEPWAAASAGFCTHLDRHPQGAKTLSSRCRFERQE